MENQTEGIHDGRPPLVVLTGPTAVGKTAASILLAKRIGGEIISADSMQVYRGMDIGTAKISRAEMQGVPHHLIDVLDPAQPFDVVRFQALAKEAIGEILSRGKIPILVGGTGFYIQAVLYDIDFSAEETDYALRAQLEEEARRIGKEALHEKLAEVDPESAGAIPAGNVKRVIRALEYYQKNGRPISRHNQEQRQKESFYRSAYFVLTDEREKIYERIDARVDEMIADGLVSEVTALRERGFTKEMVSMQGIGYRQILDYLDGACTLEEAISKVKQETRHFAKRQLTWFRRERDVIWLEKASFDTPQALVEHMTGVLALKGILSPAGK